MPQGFFRSRSSSLFDFLVQKAFVGKVDVDVNGWNGKKPTYIVMLCFRIIFPNRTFAFNLSHLLLLPLTHCQNGQKPRNCRKNEQKRCLNNERSRAGPKYSHKIIKLKVLHFAHRRKTKKSSYLLHGKKQIPLYKNFLISPFSSLPTHFAANEPKKMMAKEKGPSKEYFRHPGVPSNFSFFFHSSLPSPMHPPNMRFRCHFLAIKSRDLKMRI